MKETVEPPQCSIETAIIDGPVSMATLDVPTDCGGQCAFVGVTRGEWHEQFGKLIRLDYEAYRPMADKQLRQLAEHVAGEWPVRVIRMVHAVGPVAVGEASVVVQVAGGHRDAAFAACRALIDRLKEQLPIWKREIWQHGETFVEGAKVNGQSSHTHLRPDGINESRK